jgi:hypothetical protein
VLTFFYSNGRGGELWETFNWIYEVLKNRAYTNGSRYYYGPDSFLYFLSRLLSVSIYARQRMGKLFAKRVAEHFGAEGDALALAMRIYAATVVDLCDSRDYERLGRVDGSWPMGWMYRLVTRDILIGNKGLTTAFAVSAMRRYKELECRLSSFDYVRTYTSSRLLQTLYVRIPIFHYKYFTILVLLLSLLACYTVLRGQ